MSTAATTSTPPPPLLETITPASVPPTSTRIEPLPLTATLPSVTPTAINPLSQFVEIEFISDLVSELDSGTWYDFGPSIAVGDITGDGYPEIVVALEGDKYSDAEGLFWRHPVVYSWNGTTFEELKAKWTGIYPPTPKLSTADQQGLSTAVAIVDLDKDGVNEIIVGTRPYRNASEYGGVYIFQWNGTDFIAEHSDYCLGTVYRLDIFDNKTTVALSTFDRPITEREEHNGVCPEVPKGFSEPNSGLYSLRATGSNRYQTAPLILDNGWLTALVANPNTLSSTHFARFEIHRGRFRWEWPQAKFISVDKVIPEMVNNLPQTENRITYILSADLDSDGIDEVISSGGRNTDIGDIVVWQVLKMINTSYQIIFESPESPKEEPIYSFTIGDIDNDGVKEVLDNTGDIYKWVNNQLCYQGNLIEAIPQNLFYGLESYYVGDVYGDGQNKIIFIGRHVSDEGKCLDKYCLPRMHIVSLNSTLSTDMCQ